MCLQGDSSEPCAAPELRLALSTGAAAARLGRAADCGDAQLPLRCGALPRSAQELSWMIPSARHAPWNTL